MRRINCRQCVHYFVTWQPKQPHGCKAYGFKSPQMPSLAVFQSSGSECHLFTQKVAPT